MQDTATATETQALILTPAQAEAVYSAMCALNNVGARIDAFLEGAFHAREMADGRVVVHIVPNVTFPGSHAAEPEIYPNQSAFATAYGLEPAQRHYAVTGRICGDEEDTLLLVRGENHEEAAEAFKAELRAIRVMSSDDLEETEIFIGAVVWSNTPINE